jgi:hypothetical protein
MCRCGWIKWVRGCLDPIILDDNCQEPGWLRKMHFSKLSCVGCRRRCSIVSRAMHKRPPQGCLSSCPGLMPLL